MGDIGTPSGCIRNAVASPRPWAVVRAELTAELAGRDAWSLLKLNPLKQRRYMDALNEYCPHVESYYPVFTKLVRRNGHRRAMEIVVPVYPGYVFLKVGKEDMHVPVSLPVRARWVKFDGVVEGISDHTIKKLQELEKGNELVREVKYVDPYAPGASVRVLLPTGDLLAVIVRLAGRNVQVETSLCRVMVPKHRLQPL